MGDSDNVTMEMRGQGEDAEEPVPIPSETDKTTEPDLNGEEETEAAEEEGFVVLEEEDDGDTDGEGVEDEEKLLADKESDKEEATATSIAVDPDENGKGEGNEENQEEEIILANPLFGVNSSEEEKVEEADVPSSDINMANVEELGVEGEWECAPACLNQKRMLVAEVERLRKALGELGKRHSVLEDFIQVEYADKFARFLTNRDRLLSLGYGASTAEEAEGQRGSKSKELVELLKMIKEQAKVTVQEQRHRPDTRSPQKSRGPTVAPKGILKPPRSDPKSKPLPNSTSRTPTSSERKAFAAPSSSQPSKDATPQKRPASSSTSTTTPDAAKKRKRNPRRGTQTGGAKRLCPICNEVVRLYVLREHLLVHQQMQLPCPICKEEFPAKGQLKGHMTAKHNLSEERAIYYAGRAEGPLGPWLDGQVEKAKVPTEQQVRNYLEKIKNGRDQNPNRSERRPGGQGSSASTSSSSRYYRGRGRRPAVSSSSSSSRRY